MPWPGDESEERWTQAWTAIKRVILLIGCHWVFICQFHRNLNGLLVLADVIQNFVTSISRHEDVTWKASQNLYNSWIPGVGLKMEWTSLLQYAQSQDRSQRLVHGSVSSRDHPSWLRLRHSHHQSIHWRWNRNLCRGKDEFKEELSCVLPGSIVQPSLI